jgi:hypothetical protein
MNAETEKLARLAHELAFRLAENTAETSSVYHDRGRTRCDRRDDFEFAVKSLRNLKRRRNYGRT